MLMGYSEFLEVFRPIGEIRSSYLLGYLHIEMQNVTER